MKCCFMFTAKLDLAIEKMCWFEISKIHIVGFVSSFFFLPAHIDATSSVQVERSASTPKLLEINSVIITQPHRESNHQK